MSLVWPNGIVKCSLYANFRDSLRVVGHPGIDLPTGFPNTI